MESRSGSVGYLTVIFLVCYMFIFQCMGMPTAAPPAVEVEDGVGSTYSIYILNHEGSDMPCMAAKMASHAKLSYKDMDNEEQYVYVHLPHDAVVRGSCVEPRWMEINWLDNSGLQRYLKFSYQEKGHVSRQDQDSNNSGAIVIEKVEFSTLLDEKIFPGMLKSGEPLTATSSKLELYKKISSCGNHTVDLNSSMGPMSLSLMDVQFKEDDSEFTADEKCEPTGIDTVAIAVGCFLAAIILSAVVSYAFGQWWRSRSEQRN